MASRQSSAVSITEPHPVYEEADERPRHDCTPARVINPARTKAHPIRRNVNGLAPVKGSSHSSSSVLGSSSHATDVVVVSIEVVVVVDSPTVVVVVGGTVLVDVDDVTVVVGGRVVVDEDVVVGGTVVVVLGGTVVVDEVVVLVLVVVELVVDTGPVVVVATVTGGVDSLHRMTWLLACREWAYAWPVTGFATVSFDVPPFSTSSVHVYPSGGSGTTYGVATGSYLTPSSHQ